MDRQRSEHGLFSDVAYDSPPCGATRPPQPQTCFSPVCSRELPACVGSKGGQGHSSLMQMFSLVGEKTVEDVRVAKWLLFLKLSFRNSSCSLPGTSGSAVVHLAYCLSDLSVLRRSWDPVPEGTVPSPGCTGRAQITWLTGRLS